MSPSAKSVYQLIEAIRACFRELRALSDTLHSDIGVRTPTRAVMEYLAEGAPATVPDIARAKHVSRQNIQVLVDALIAGGIAETLDNPGHKRSSLVTLTARGRRTFGEMRSREQAVLAAIACDLPRAGIEPTLLMLGALLRRVEAENRKVSNRERIE